mmetsp:Transcript_82195/g.211802  ORF Transcript_82195/g.211802 Transcript_82195/m.211802 type:complete len:627 (+) Transcript_82195:481-2361(+)
MSLDVEIQGDVSHLAVLLLPPVRQRQRRFDHVQGYRHHLCLPVFEKSHGGVQEVALLDHVADLRVGAAVVHDVVDRTGGLPAGRGALVADRVQEPRHQARVDDRLDLRLRARRHVGEHQAHLLADAALRVVHEAADAGHQADVQDRLRALVVAAHEHAEGPQGRRLHHGARVLQQVDHAPGHARLDNLPDRIVTEASYVGEPPAHLIQALLVLRALHARCEDGDRGLDGAEGRPGLAPDVVGQGPRRVLHRGRLHRAQHLQRGLQGALAQHDVAELRRVARDVAQGPDGLAPHLNVRRAQQLDEDRHSAVVYDHACLVCTSRTDVCECPAGLELQLGPCRLLQVLNEARHDAGVDGLLDRRVVRRRELLAELAQLLHELLRRLADELRVAGAALLRVREHVMDQLRVGQHPGPNDEFLLEAGLHLLVLVPDGLLELPHAGVARQPHVAHMLSRCRHGDYHRHLGGLAAHRGEREQIPGHVGGRYRPGEDLIHGQVVDGACQGLRAGPEVAGAAAPSCFRRVRGCRRLLLRSRRRRRGGAGAEDGVERLERAGQRLPVDEVLRSEALGIRRLQLQPAAQKVADELHQSMLLQVLDVFLSGLGHAVHLQVLRRLDCGRRALPEEEGQE